MADTLTDHAIALYAAAIGYTVGAIWLAHRVSMTHLSLPFIWRRLVVGSGRGGLLDFPAFLFVDLLVAMGLNLTTAVLLYDGTIYSQYADLYAVASITTVALWTGRRGGKIGLGIAGLVMTTEVAKAPLNGIALIDIDWTVV
ncbi:MAG: hypothetical protein AB7Q27_27050, partial [Acidimicrobiia bacterium]